MRLLASILVTLMAATGCATHQIRPWQYTPRPLADTLAIWEPSERDVPLIYDVGHTTLIQPVANAFNVPRHVRGPGPARNADPMDEVVNSAWFTNRMALGTMTPEEVARGPHQVTGPAGPITITDDKSEGVNVGFFIEDARGERYLVKLDLPDWPEMASGADALATKLVWASGYYTPENYVFFFDPDSVRLEEGYELDVVEDGRIQEYEVGANEPDEKELTLTNFQRILLSEHPRRPDGTIRALASRFVEGSPKGPFNWTGRRPDDPNDVVPHEHRRELRGYYVVASWLNQTDTKQGNTLDSFILAPGSPEDEDEGRRFGYLRHYMLDNGAALGSGGIRPHDTRKGSENELDLDAIGKRFLGLGFYERAWQDEVKKPPTYPEDAIGWYEADIFDPGDWRPNLPNQAFNNVDARDGYWGAKIVMSFTDAQLDRAIDETQWSSVPAKAYILRGLKARRDKIGRYWFAEVSPLDDPRIVDRAVLVFEDLWARHFGGPAEYRVEFEWDAPQPDLTFQGDFREPRITLPMPTGSVTSDGDIDDQHARVRVWKRQEGGDWAPRPATFFLRWDGSSYQVVGARY